MESGLFNVQNGIIVVPVIGILPDRNSFIPAPNTAEVDAIFDAPLEMFLKVVHLIYSSFHFLLES